MLLHVIDLNFDLGNNSFSSKQRNEQHAIKILKKASSVDIL